MSTFDEFISEARTLRAAGLSYKTIADRLGRHHSFVRKALLDPEKARTTFHLTRAWRDKFANDAPCGTHVYHIIGDDYQRVDLAARAAGVLRRAAERRV